MAAYVRVWAWVRLQEGRVIAGVCAGLGRRFGLSPWTARGQRPTAWEGWADARDPAALP
jgi:hypothetical protein